MAHGTASPDGELYRQFFEAADDGFCLVEMMPGAGGAPADARILAVNAAFARETGLAAAEGGSLRALAPAAAEVWIAALCRIAESGRPETVEVEGPGGPCEVRGFPVGAAAERKVGFRLEDIRARRQAEEAGRAAVWQLRHVLSGMGEAFGILDHDLRILIQNHAALRLDGRTLEEIRGRSHWDVYPGSEDSELGRLYRRALAEGVPVSMEHRYEWPDGSVSWLKMRACPVPEGLAVFWHDITERKEAELSLRESEARYRGLFEAMDEGFILARVLRDGEGRAVDAVLLEGNPLASRMTGLSPIDGQRLSEVLPVPDPVWLETCDRVSRTGVTERLEHRAAGWGHWYDFSVSTVNVPGGGQDGTPCLAILFTDITDRKRTEEALRMSEERFRALATTGGAAIYRMSPDWRIMYQLDPTSQLDGTESPIDDWPEKYILEEDRPMVLQAIERAIRDRIMFALEHRVRRADGGIGWVLSRAAPMTGPDGAIREWFGTAIDVTERREAVERMTRSEERLQLALDVGRLGTWDWDIRQGALLWSEEHYRMQGYAPGEVEPSYEAWLARVHPEDRAAAEAELLAAHEKGSEYAATFRSLHPDGRVVWLRALGRFYPDAAGRPSRMIGIMEDITEARRADEALRESEERFRQFGEASSDVLWIGDARTIELEYLSPAFEEIYGVDRAATMAEDGLQAWLELIVPEDRALALDGIERVRLGEHVSSELRIRRPVDGELRWLRNSVFPLRDPSGALHRIGGIGHDITEEKRVGERLQVLVAELQHRTRNLLTVVRAIAARTLSSAGSLADFRTRFEDRLLALARVNGLLSRLEEGDRITFDELIRAELEGHGLPADDGAGPQVMLEGPRGIPLRSSSVQTFALALHELTTNALKHGALARPEGRLHVVWRLVEVSGAPHLRVDWRETGGPAVPEAKPALAGSGYGRELIERALPYQLGAVTTYDLGPEGLSCTVILPVSAHLAPTPPAAG
ncbi:PAS domain S-box protein [Cereibacter sphaeroides]|uniref:PAS domain S-box protein n=1 Tax=Cereibacter sphaeroides TaxID=1063 RepID=UPI00313E73D9